MTNVQYLVDTVHVQAMTTTAPAEPTTTIDELPAPGSHEVKSSYLITDLAPTTLIE